MNNDKTQGLYVSLIKEGETTEGILIGLIKATVKEFSKENITNETARKYIIALPQAGKQGQALIKPFYYKGIPYPLLVKQDDMSTILIAPAYGLLSTTYQTAIGYIEEIHPGTIIPNLVFDPSSFDPVGIKSECRY